MDHTIVHFEIPAENIEKLRKFYADLFGWKFQKMEGQSEYWMIGTVPIDEKGMPTRPGVNGGMWKKQKGMKPVNYISVESADDFVKKIQKLGGKVTVPKTEIPGIGWYAVAEDPEGNAFGILQPKQM